MIFEDTIFVKAGTYDLRVRVEPVIYLVNLAFINRFQKRVFFNRFPFRTVKTIFIWFNHWFFWQFRFFLCDFRFRFWYFRFTVVRISSGRYCLFLRFWIFLSFDFWLSKASNAPTLIYKCFHF